MHTQAVFGCLGLGNNQGEDNVKNQYGPKRDRNKRNGHNGQQHYGKTHPHRLDAPIATEAREDTAQQFVVGVAIEAFLRFLLTEPLTSTVSGRGGSIFFTTFTSGLIPVLGITYAPDDFLHQCNIYRLTAIVFQLQHQFAHTMFNVVGNLFASLLTGEIFLYVAQVTVKQLVCVFINGI